MKSYEDTTPFLECIYLAEIENILGNRKYKGHILPSCMAEGSLLC